ncbi:GNAT family N-acetyltransferase [Actinotalea sp. K2]|nr:GNAT family N-acetyltransferase [Actinotalea sp. K2]
MAELVTLCLAARKESSVGTQVCSPDPEVLAHQLGALTAVEGGTVLVARSDQRVVGLLLGRVVGPNPFTDEANLAVEVLYVGAEHRRRGVGHALMVGALDVAAASGAEHIYATPLPGARGMQRFFVQLGFAPAAAHRVVSTSALQRRLAADLGVTRRGSARGLEGLIARRRQSRLDSTRSGGEPPRPGTVDLAIGAEEDGIGQAGRSSISRQVRRAVQTRRDAESSTTIS